MQLPCRALEPLTVPTVSYTHLHCSVEDKAEVFQIATTFKVDVADIGEDSVLLECKLTERRNNELIALLKRRFRTIEVVRGGAVAIESISTSCR